MAVARRTGNEGCFRGALARRVIKGQTVNTTQRLPFRAGPSSSRTWRPITVAEPALCNFDMCGLFQISPDECFQSSADIIGSTVKGDLWLQGYACSTCDQPPAQSPQLSAMALLAQLAFKTWEGCAAFKNKVQNVSPFFLFYYTA